MHNIHTQQNSMVAAYPAMESGVGVHVATAINHPHVPRVTFRQLTVRHGIIIRYPHGTDDINVRHPYHELPHLSCALRNSDCGTRSHPTHRTGTLSARRSRRRNGRSPMEDTVLQTRYINSPQYTGQHRSGIGDRCSYGRLREP